jgi:hypothetical protein
VQIYAGKLELGLDFPLLHISGARKSLFISPIANGNILKF